MTTRSGSSSRHFLPTGHRNQDATPEDEVHNSSVAAPEIAEPLEINTSIATQVGHQLALIGDEYNRTYSWKEEESLLSLAKGMAARAFQACLWNNFKSIMKSLGSFFNNNWRKKVFDYGHWILLLPLQYLSQKWVPVTLLAILMWWLLSQGLQD